MTIVIQNEEVEKEEIDLEACARDYQLLMSAQRETRRQIGVLREKIVKELDGETEVEVGEFHIIFTEYDAETMWSKKMFLEKYGTDWVNSHKTYELRARLNVKAK